MDTFTEIAVVGIILSLVYEGIQRTFGSPENSLTSKAIVVVLSIVVGGAYFFLNGTVIWQNILGVLAAASTVYAFFFAGKKG